MASVFRRKKCGVVGEEALPAGKGNQVSPATDWEICPLCQTSSTEKLVHPSNEKCKGDEKRSGYNVLAELLPEFEKLGNIPLHIDTRRLDDGSDIEETMCRNNAV